MPAPYAVLLMPGSATAADGSAARIESAAAFTSVPNSAGVPPQNDSELISFSTAYVCTPWAEYRFTTEVTNALYASRSLGMNDSLLFFVPRTCCGSLRVVAQQEPTRILIISRAPTSCAFRATASMLLQLWLPWLDSTSHQTRSSNVAL